ncbi:MAG: hypothetical protein JWM57_1518 [Phycisphaerales bacterium]|nr:hypothetical protein [Phycisphaerales bacterium]
MNTKRIAMLSILSLGVALANGCAASANDSAARNAKLIPSETLVLDQPAVRESEGTLHVTGNVRQQDFSPVRSPGHVHVQMTDHAGSVITSTAARLTPPPGRKTPRTPDPRSAVYHAHLPGPLPEGSALRIVVCNQDHRSADHPE